MIYPFVQAHSDYGVRKGPALAFIIHMAEGGGTVGFLSRENARGVSVHYVIEGSGRIVQMLLESHASGSIDPTKIRTSNGPDPYGATAARAVLGAWASDPNSACLSVEVEGFASVGPNALQDVALFKLVTDIRTRHPDIGLLGHRDFADYKACPGEYIPWKILGGHGPATMEDPDMVKFKAPPDEVGGTITATRDTLAIPIGGGTRPSVRAGITRPALGVFTLTDLADRPCYLMLVGTQLCFIGAADVTFAQDDTQTAAIPIEYAVTVGGKAAGKVTLP